MPGEGVVKLKQGAMSRVWVGEKHGVRKVLGQSIGVRDGNHFVMDAVDHERRLMNGIEISEASPGRLLPVPKRRHLRGGNIRSGWWVEVLFPQREPLEKHAAGRLARRSLRKEDLLQYRVSRECRIGKMCWPDSVCRGA